ncbi:uncharacterized protein TRUGW13939_02278 [Talaromyces rugulosus]|uniref:Uncharacterized protein n=1 Tax=Talaromyces rugulosus TaxID=121627 RepID=A0A7H8QMT9_TALRU|nr:uncharacterized protein TRUGW13939_02278 [Talaromyces rugulosus]QKX55186.1 hypothetical protein TRUGW13939_02278 [Talaromyces rugulosus]
MDRRASGLVGEAQGRRGRDTREQAGKRKVVGSSVGGEFSWLGEPEAVFPDGKQRRATRGEAREEGARGASDGLGMQQEESSKIDDGG